MGRKRGAVAGWAGEGGREKGDIELEHSAAKLHSETQRGGDRRAGAGRGKEQKRGNQRGQEEKEEHQRERREDTVEQQKRGQTR